MGATTKTLYDTDFVEWTARTAELVRSGRLSEVDLEQVAEEIEDLGKRDRASAESLLFRILLHQVKRKIQPERDGASWRKSIVDRPAGDPAEDPGLSEPAAVSPGRAAAIGSIGKSHR